MSIYLSIDLDYWRSSYKVDCNTFFKQVFKRAKQKNIKIKLYCEHEELLPEVNASGCDKLYNVDYHSDICAKCEMEDKAIDGDWVNHVNWRKKGSFVWLYPDKAQCVDEHGGFCHCRHNPFVNKKECDWKRIKHQLTIPDMWWDVDAIGVCFSPFWSYLQPIEDVLKEFNVDLDKANDIVERARRNYHHAVHRLKRGVIGRWKWN